MATAITNLVFLPWVRRGLASAIVRQDAPGGPPQVRPSFTVAVTAQSGTDNLQTSLTLPLIGPGDIAGLDSRVIVRTTPGRDETNAEYKHFVSVEFDQADLPWRYTPAAAAGQKLHPWLTLIVLKDIEWKALPATTSQKLPGAQIDDISVLPPLTDGWASAHVQLHGQAETATNPTALAAVLTGQPGLFVARLICPRVLSQQTRYTAMLVPTYKRGALAGLGAEIPPGLDTLDFAWGSAASVTLPIYYQWQFQTGVVGSFRDLALELSPQPVPKTVGRRDLDVSQPGFDLPNATPPPSTPPTTTNSTSMPMEGALQSFQASQLPEPTPSTGWVTALEQFVNTLTTLVDGVPRRLVAPPLYGRWQAGETQLVSGNRPWFRTLNTDPRDRTSAGLGTLVVEARHQDLMASAWDQIEGLLDANKERKVLQLGREAYNRIFTRHFLTGSVDSQLLALGTLQRWTLRAAGDITIHSDFAQSTVGRSIFDPQWRRLARPRGQIGRRQLRHLPGKAPFLPGPVNKMSGPTPFQPAPPRPKPTGMITPSAVFGGIVPGNLKPPQITILTGQGNDPMLFWGILLFCTARKLLAAGAGRSWWWLVRLIRFAIGLIRLAGGTASTSFRVALRDGTLTPGQITGAPGSANFQPITTIPAVVPNPIPPPPAPGGTDNAAAAAFRQAYAAMLNAYAAPGVHFVPPTQINVATTSTLFMQLISPSVTLQQSTLARLKLDPSLTWDPVDKLDPVQVAPTFGQAMWVPLRDESPDWILPGLDQVANNSVGLVVSNQRFIEGYMVGLNHEMARTLLWNGYPTDQRGTYFRQFWDSRATAASGDQRDIKAITDWGNAALGVNSARTSPAALVLLIRGDLINRYPNTVVYALQPPPGVPPDPTLPQTTPLFSGRITADVGFYGFTIPRQQSANYSFVLQEQPAEPRFAGPVATTPVNPPAPVFVTPTQVGATSAADFATKTWQHPTRVVIPGSLLVPST